MASPPDQPQHDHVDRFIETLDIEGLDPLVEGIVDRLIGLGRRLHRSLDQALTEVGLSAGEWGVLTSLRTAGPPYRASPGRLAARAQLSSGAMTNRLDRLENAGLVRRLPDPDDRRGVQVELTDEGLATWQRAADAQTARESIVSTTLDPAACRQLNDLLRQLMIAFEETER